MKPLYALISCPKVNLASLFDFTVYVLNKQIVLRIIPKYGSKNWLL